MSKPDNFILNTDFPTLKNDNRGNATVSIPSSITITGNSYAEYHYDLPIGIKGAICNVRSQSSKNSDKWVSAQGCVFLRTGDIGGYNVAIFVYRISATTVRCQIYIPNPYNTTLTGESGVETVNFHINTYIPPFK